MSIYQPLQGGIAGLNADPTGLLQRGLGGSLAPAGLTPLPAAPITSLAGQAAQAGPLFGPPAPASLAQHGIRAAQAGQSAGSWAPRLLGGAGVGGNVVEGAGGLRGALASLGPRVLGEGGLTFAKGPAMGAGLYGLAGSVGSNLIDRVNIGGNQSNWEQGLQGAAQGAGVGAGVGLLTGPGSVITVPVGAAVGGLIGGGIGILANMFGGGDDKEEVDPVQILGNAINTAGLDPATTEEILTTYETLAALAEAQPEGEARDAALSMAFEQTAQMVLGAMQQGEQAQQQATNTLAIQAQAGQIFEPLAQDIETSGLLYADAMKGIRDTLPESYRAIADATTARELSSSQKLANAYRAQAAIQPIAQQLTQYQQDNANYAAQMFSQALAQQAAGQTGGGGASQADVLANLQGL